MQDSAPNQLPRLVDSSSKIKELNDLERIALVLHAFIYIFNLITIPFALGSDQLNTSDSGIIYGLVIFLELFFTPSLWHIISKSRNRLYWLPINFLWFAVTWRFNLSLINLFGVFDFFADPSAFFEFPLPLFSYISLIGSFLSMVLLSISWMRDRRVTSS